jgi:hypothetical protein
MRWSAKFIQILNFPFPVPFEDSLPRSRGISLNKSFPISGSRAFFSFSNIPSYVLGGGRESDLSYLLTGVAATGNDGHTANFHDCRNILVSMESVKHVVKIEYVHFIVKVPVAARFGGWFVEVRNSRDRSVRFFAWAGRGFRASVICVLIRDWVSYRLVATSLVWEYFPIGTRRWGFRTKQ